MRSRVSRRTVLVTAAGIGATACAPPAPSAEPEVPPPAPPTRTVLARTADVPLAGGLVLPEHRVVVTQPTPGVFRGFGIVCTHDGCELDAVADGTINCPCHGSRFSIADGSVVRGPARSGLRTERVAVDGDRVVLL